MSDPMNDIRASFFIECEELLEGLFDALQTMSDGSADDETINVAFRAVHSIKGGAGAFALDQVVSFAHHFETAMDDVRSGKLAPSDDLVQLFFRCGDILSDLVRAARDETTVDAALVDPVLEELGKYSTSPDSGEAEEEISDFQPLTLDLGDLGAPADGADDDFDALLASLPPLPSDDEPQEPVARTVVFRPEPELYKSGNEPLFLLRSLGELRPSAVRLDFDPDSAPGARMTWTVEFDDPVKCEMVEEVFEFVQGLCTLSFGSDASPRESVPAEEAAGTFAPADLPMDKIPEPASPTSDVAPPLATIDPAATDEDGPAEATTAMPGGAPKGGAAPKNMASPTVRVDLSRVDRLVNLVGELVINQAMLSQSVAQSSLGSNTAITSGLEEFLQLTRDIQESVMMIRAQPVKSLFQRMSRIVREASAAVGKKVVLTTDGENTEIDKTVIERLADPLTHMIRNAVDHGLEKTEDRQAAGKPAEGQVRLSASHKSGRVVIEVSDDGGGINRPKVRQIAIDKGLIPEDAALTDGEIDQLLFMPGFSTATTVSNLSGRGVGMDVVKNAITALGGRISITSHAGKGTTFSISLPLTLAVLDGMVVSVAGEALVMPLNAIVETLTLDGESVRRLGPNSNVVLVRESFVPLLDLGVELGYRAPKENYAGAIALLSGQEDGHRAALVVDSIEDQRQVVIKGIQDSYGRVPGVAAATILGDGQIALILDPSDLIQNSSGQSRAPANIEAV
ncbi:chemotaxis protein CheA [Alphaproteobacteria bacterium GH1-50]|uniref:Chemotaxis protein CheA n=1 Tax=Kangsaoukella pontilimi TaxID=2691042 RepID=A0A7C9MYN6_9RHOB|nr:chemotaxis protein CheA [Kangsaoukella pontilimi]MXQ06898.1 chemotaxis protein CheA [Kangsaoukella pontilimi]